MWRVAGQAGGTSESSTAMQQAPTIRVVSHSQGNNSGTRAPQPWQWRGSGV
jgi:hypothetical protein